MAFTEEQKRALNARGVNVLVSASAGSGKTTVMVERILALIEEGESLRDMLICTYTNAAASDMREKISSRLIEKSLGGDERFTEQIKLLPTARIGTIDSWCQKVVKNYFYLVEASADFDVMDEGELTATAYAVMDREIEKRLTGGDVEFLDVYESMIEKRTDLSFKQKVFSICRFASTQENPERWLLGSVDNYDDVRANKIINDYFARRRSVVEKEINALLEDAIAVKYEKLAEYCSLLTSKLFGNIERLPSFTKKNEDYPDLNKRREDLMDRVNRLLKEINGCDELEDSAVMIGTAKVLTDFCLQTYRELKKVKLDKCRLDYNDIEHLAYEIVKDKVAGEEIRKSNKFVFVDEYQDVNPLQDALISNIVGENLYVVGDVKQSIYAFRMSDPDIFIDKYANYQKYGFAQPIEFCMNFRSKTEILDYCNDVFRRAMTPDFGKVNYHDVALQSGKKEYGGRVKMYLLPKKVKQKEQISGLYSVMGDDGEAEDRGEDMSTIVANRITALLGTEMEINGEVRAVEPKDIAVLFRASTAPSLRLLYDKLKASGVEVFIKNKTRFDSEDEIKPLIVFLRAVLDGTDEVALASYLLSCFGGLDENQLYEAVKKGKGIGFVAKMRDYATAEGETALKLKLAFERLEKYGKLSANLTVCELLGELISETQYFNRVLKGESGQAGAIIVAQYLDYLSGLKFATTLGDYLDYSESGSQEFEPIAPENALKIMTVHSSKGLEFPFVFLIDCEQEFNKRGLSDAILLDKELGVSACRRDESGKNTVKNRLWLATKIKKSLSQKEEALRLLYVALTRAREGLFMFATDTEKRDVEPFEADSFFDWLIPVSGAVVESASRDEELAFTGENGEAESAVADAKTVDAIRERIEFVYPHKSHKLKASVTGIAGEAEISAAQRSDDDDRIMALGTAYHKIMEEIDFSADFDLEVKRLSRLFTEDINVSYIKTAFGNVNEILKRHDGDIFKEQSFVYKREDGTLVQGIIDLLIVGEKQAVILDYKLTGAKDLVKPEYVDQLNMYASAVEDVLKVPVTALYLCSFSGGVVKSVERTTK